VFGEHHSLDRHLTVTEEVDQEYKMEQEPPNWMHYSKSFKKLIMGTESGIVGVLPVEAEVFNYEEEDDEGQEEKEKKMIVTPFVEIGRFHTARIGGIKELGDTTQLATISDDLSLAIWEATSNSMLAKESLPSKPTVLAVSTDGKAAFVGSENGVLRVFDVSNRTMPRLVSACKFFEGLPITHLIASHDGHHVLVSSKESDSLYFMSQQVEKEFEVLGHYVFPGFVLGTSFVTDNGDLRGLAVLSNNLLVGFHLPSKAAKNKMEQYPESQIQPKYAKIDRGVNMVVGNVYNGDILVCGEDRFLKKYEFPQEAFSRIDFRKPPPAPVEEFKSHDLSTVCCDFSNELKFMATGGTDGKFILRNMS